MATFGWDTVNWGSSWEFYGWNTENNVSTGNVTFPQSGTITAIVFNCDCFLNGQAGPMVANGCLWNSSGTLLVSGSQVTLNNVGQHAGPYAWHTSTCSYAISSGAVIRMGWWRNPALAAGDNIFGYGNGGTTLLGTTANSVGPGSFGQDNSQSLQVGVYVIYTPTNPPPAPAPPPSSRTQQTNQAIYELIREGLLPK